MSFQTRIVARAVIQKDNQILLCRVLNEDHYFFPGGGIEFQESAEDTLRREMMEELDIKVKQTKFIGALENQFEDKGKPIHEVYLMFSVQIEDGPVESKEDHIGFVWLPIEKLTQENILPKHMMAAVVQWLKDGQVFWAGLNK